jgi:hypothetical protein
VRHDSRSRRASQRLARRRRAFSDTTLDRLGLQRLQGKYGQAMADADSTPPPPTEPATQPSALDIVRNPDLSLDEKRSILMNRAFDEYEHGERANGASETRWLRLREIEQALLELERGSRQAVVSEGPTPCERCSF